MSCQFTHSKNFKPFKQKRTPESEHTQREREARFRLRDSQIDSSFTSLWTETYTQSYVKIPILASILVNTVGYVLGCFHTSTFGAHPRSFDVIVRFVWMMWTLSSDLGCAPANRTRVRLKRVVWGSVHVNSGTVRCWCERNRTKSRKWTAIDDVLFDKNVCLCVFHSLSWRACLSRYKQWAVCHISVHLQRSLERLLYIRKTDVSAVIYRRFVNKTNGSKT